jgi:hypothetical protein
MDERTARASRDLPRCLARHAYSEAKIGHAKRCRASGFHRSTGWWWATYSMMDRVQGQRRAPRGALSKWPGIRLCSGTRRQGVRGQEQAYRGVVWMSGRDPTTGGACTSRAILAGADHSNSKKHAQNPKRHARHMFYGVLDAAACVLKNCM